MFPNKLILSVTVGLLALAVPSLRAEPSIEDKHHDPHNSSCISFENFIDQVKHAKFEDYKHTEVECKNAFDDMKGHILSMYGGVSCAEKVTTFVLDVEYGDCILIEEQPTVHLLGIPAVVTPPTSATSLSNATHVPVPGVFKHVDSPLKLGLKDLCGKPVSCPKHTVPIARLTLEKLTRFPTLSDFFAKTPQESSGQLDESDRRRQIPPDVSGAHLHAIGFQDVVNFGGNSWLDLWSPVGDFSISQQWYIGGSGNGTQTVEGGWQVYPQKYNTQKAVLFIYWTANNYSGTGCYNHDCSGFVQTNNNWFLGGIWDHYSVTNGTQWGFEMQWKLYAGNWWLWLKGPGAYEAVGYYPTSLYNGGPLSKQSRQIQFGGEVARQTGHNWPQMGSGAFPLTGWERAAFQNTIFSIPRDENGGVGVWADLSSFVESLSSCFSINIVEAANGGSWGTYFFFGGPGANTCN